MLSSPNASAGAFTVNEENFEKALTLHAVKKIPKPTWLNDRNQFLIPHTQPSEEFTNDCIIWSLFANSNQTTSLRNVQYSGNTYQIKNNFFPFKISEVKTWEVKEPDFRVQMTNEADRFAANWIANNELSKEAEDVLSKGKEVYKLYFSHLNQMATYKWKIDSWDAGWYQIRRCLAEHNLGADEMEAVKIANENLANKILPQIETFGFLDKDVVYEEI
jgi:hypothetical protein